MDKEDISAKLTDVYNELMQLDVPERQREIQSIADDLGKILSEMQEAREKELRDRSASAEAQSREKIPLSREIGYKTESARFHKNQAVPPVTWKTWLAVGLVSALLAAVIVLSAVLAAR
jgi:hypothetical protein